MALGPEQIRRGAIVLVRLPDDKGRPALVVRADILAELGHSAEQIRELSVGGVVAGLAEVR